MAVSKETWSRAFRIRQGFCRFTVRIRYSFRLSEDSFGIRNSMLTFLTDLVVVLAGSAIFRDIDGAVYGMLINFLTALMVDRVLCGLNAGKVGLIVTERATEVCECIDACSGRGSTILEARGGYRQEEKQVVMVACSRKEMYQILSAVKQLDDEAFMIVMDSGEVHGQGFRVVQQ